MRSKLRLLSESIERELKKVEAFAKETRNSANEISKTAAGSHSAAGDRFHSEAQARIASENLDNIRKLKSELDVALAMKAPSSIESACFIKLIVDGIEQELFYVENPVFISGYKLVSSHSPLGKAIKGKKSGEKFNFANGGIVLSIE